MQVTLALPVPLAAPDGLANLRAILEDQPFQNSSLSVFEINLILANEGGLMPDEAVVWFRASRGALAMSSQDRVPQTYEPARRK